MGALPQADVVGKLLQNGGASWKWCCLLVVVELPVKRKHARTDSATSTQLQLQQQGTKAHDQGSQRQWEGRSRKKALVPERLA